MNVEKAILTWRSCLHAGNSFRVADTVLGAYHCVRPAGVRAKPCRKVMSVTDLQS